MLSDPTERNVNPFLFRTRIRTVKKLVQTLAIHDKNVTMAKTAQASITARTRLALPFAERMGARSHPQVVFQQEGEQEEVPYLPR